MLAFHGDDKLKAFVLSELAVHRQADELIKGVYWEDGKGCAVGCTLEAVKHFRKAQSIDHRRHALYEEHLGIPQIIARLEDVIFENLSNGNAQVWPERFTQAIRPGSDLSGIWPKFAVWLLIDPTLGVIRFAKTDRTRKAVQDVADTYSRAETDKEAWRGLRADAAAAAADAPAYNAARSKHYEIMADKLIELLELAP